MAVEHILGLVTFIVIILALSLLLPTGSPRWRRSRASDAGAATTGAWFADSGGNDCGADGGGGCDGGGGD